MWLSHGWKITKWLLTKINETTKVSVAFNSKENNFKNSRHKYIKKEITHTTLSWITFIKYNLVCCSSSCSLLMSVYSLLTIDLFNKVSYLIYLFTTGYLLFYLSRIIIKHSLISRYSTKFILKNQSRKVLNTFRQASYVMFYLNSNNNTSSEEKIVTVLIL